MESIQRYIILSLQVTFVFSIQCHKQFVKRGQICCRPVFNCQPGHSIEPCQRMNGTEVCQPCSHGYVQPNFISSLDTSRKCFLKKAECPTNDLTYSTERKYCYPKHCKCNSYNCYRDDHCVCVKTRPCPVNQTLDPITGVCQPCPEFTYKNEVGCGPCVTDKQAWVNRKISLDNDTVQNDNNSGTNGEKSSCKSKQRALNKRIKFLRRKLNKTRKLLRKILSDF